MMAPAGGRRVRFKKLVGFAVARRGDDSVFPALYLLERFVDQPLVVFLREVSLDDFRRDHYREIDRLVPNLLERARGFELDLTLGVLDDVVGFGARFRADLLAQPLAVGSALRDDAVGLDARARDDLRRPPVQPLQLLLRLLRIVQ